MSPEDLRLNNYTPIQRGCVIAEVDITILPWNLTMRKIQECVKEENRWFNFPSFCEEEFGKKKWKPYVELELSANKEALFKVLREKIDTLVAANPELVPKTLEFSAEEMPF